MQCAAVARLVFDYLDIGPRDVAETRAQKMERVRGLHLANAEGLCGRADIHIIAGVGVGDCACQGSGGRFEFESGTGLPFALAFFLPFGYASGCF